MSTARILADYPSLIDPQSLTSVNADSIGGSMRNMIINGDMVIAQRKSPPTMTVDRTYPTFSGYTTVDRWKSETNVTDQVILTFSQDNDAPNEFDRSFKVLVDTAENALDAAEYLRVTHSIEQQDLLRLNYGTATPKSVALSFWVKSGTIGTYSITLTGNNNTPRSIGSTYDVLVADTWEKKTVTFSGDAGGVMSLSSDTGLKLHWTLSAGSDYTTQSNSSWGDFNANNMSFGQNVNLMSTALNYWNLTGVQMEVGPVVTAFEHKAHSLELQMCQRYYQTISTNMVLGCVVTSSSGDVKFSLPLCTPMRATPTVDVRTSANITLGDADSNAVTGQDPEVNSYEENATSVFMDLAGGSGLTLDRSAYLYWQGYDMAFEAEL